MKKTAKYISLITVILFFISCGDDKNAQQQTQQKPPAFPVFEVPTKTVSNFTDYPASIEGVINSEVRAKVSGYITEVLIDEGQKVKAGQTLFKLETQSLNQDADAAKANVNAAQVEVDKLKPLVDKNIISNVQLESAKAKLQQAKSSYNSIAANIGYANIKSPVDGYVGSIRLRKGALVSPGDQMPLTTVSDISEVYAYFAMNEKAYLDFLRNTEGKTVEDKIKNIPEVRLRLANGDIYEEMGKIETINSQINQNTGSVSFRATFNNPSRVLTNGNSGKVEIPQTFENAVIIPQGASFEQQGNILVYRVRNDSVFSSITKIKSQAGNLYVVESGVEEGDILVASGLGKLRGGTKITPNKVPFDSVAEPLEKTFR